MCEQIKTFTFIQIQNWNLCCLRADCRSDIWTSIWEKRRIYLSALCVCVRSMRPKSVNFFLWPINNFHIPFNNYIILQDVCCLGVGCSKRSKQASEAHSHHRTSSCVEQIIKETFAQIIIIVYMLRSGVEGDGRPATQRHTIIQCEQDWHFCISHAAFAQLIALSASFIYIFEISRCTQ